MGTHKHAHKLSAAGLLISLGIIYGDIGTSPLYVFKSITGTRLITPDLILGGLSCVFWTLTLQTTIKYVLITLQADNKGEGGIFWNEPKFNLSTTMNVECQFVNVKIIDKQNFLDYMWLVST